MDMQLGRGHLLLIVVVLGADGDLVGDEVDGVETDTELTDEVDIATLLELLEEGRSTGLGNCSEIVDEVLLGHTDTPIGEGEGIVGLVWSDLRRAGDMSEAELVSRDLSQRLTSDLVTSDRYGLRRVCAHPHLELGIVALAENFLVGDGKEADFV